MGMAQCYWKCSFWMLGNDEPPSRTSVCVTGNGWLPANRIWSTSRSSLNLVGLLHFMRSVRFLKQLDMMSLPETAGWFNTFIFMFNKTESKMKTSSVNLCSERKKYWSIPAVCLPVSLSVTLSACLSLCPSVQFHFFVWTNSEEEDGKIKLTVVLWLLSVSTAIQPAWQGDLNSTPSEPQTGLKASSGHWQPALHNNLSDLETENGNLWQPADQSVSSITNDLIRNRQEIVSRT